MCVMNNMGYDFLLKQKCVTSAPSCWWTWKCYAIYTFREGTLGDRKRKIENRKIENTALYADFFHKTWVTCYNMEVSCVGFVNVSVD